MSSAGSPSVPVTTGSVVLRSFTESVSLTVLSVTTDSLLQASRLRHQLRTWGTRELAAAGRRAGDRALQARNGPEPAAHYRIASGFRRWRAGAETQNAGTRPAFSSTRDGQLTWRSGDGTCPRDRPNRPPSACPYRTGASGSKYPS